MSQEDQNKKIEIHPLPVLTDNIIWIWVIKNLAIVVDPSIALPVKDWLDHRRLKLLAILQTHHHEDHIGGTKELLRQWPKAEVIASKADLQRIPFQTISVTDQDKLIINSFCITVLDIPGHTRTHIAFHVKDNLKKQSILFCGDTLFSGGCGRLFEGTPEDMFMSLKRLNNLPQGTKIYCGHEYTEENLKWALSLYPEDASIKKRLEEIIKLREAGITSLPSTLKEERKTNLFIQAQNVKEFSYLRRHKDTWSA